MVSMSLVPYVNAGDIIDNIPCDWFESVREWLHNINTTYPNYDAHEFFSEKKSETSSEASEVRCLKKDYPI